MGDFSGFPLREGQRNPTYEELHAPHDHWERPPKFPKVWVHQWVEVPSGELHRGAPSSPGALLDYALSEGWAPIRLRQAYHMGELKLRHSGRKYTCALTTSVFDGFQGGWFFGPVGGPLRTRTLTEAKDVLAYPGALDLPSEPDTTGQSGLRAAATSLAQKAGATILGSKVTGGDKPDFLVPEMAGKRDPRAHLELFHRWGRGKMSGFKGDLHRAHEVEHRRGAGYRRHRHVPVREILDVE